MSKNEVTSDIFTPGLPIKVISRHSMFYDRLGVVVRLGTAGDVLYVHCLLQGINTVIAFRDFELCKADASKKGH